MTDHKTDKDTSQGAYSLFFKCHGQPFDPLTSLECVPVDTHSDPVEGVDYEIEEEEPSGLPCPVCKSPQEVDYKGQLFCAPCIAEYHDRYAGEDASLNMRINGNLLDDLKVLAKRQGERSYQRFIKEVLTQYVRQQRVS